MTDLTIRSFYNDNTKSYLEFKLESFAEHTRPDGHIFRIGRFKAAMRPFERITYFPSYGAATVLMPGDPIPGPNHPRLTWRPIQNYDGLPVPCCNVHGSQLQRQGVLYICDADYCSVLWVHGSKASPASQIVRARRELIGNCYEYYPEIVAAAIKRVGGQDATIGRLNVHECDQIIKHLRFNVTPSRPTTKAQGPWTTDVHCRREIEIE